jgi:hypothetical protein
MRPRLHVEVHGVDALDVQLPHAVGQQPLQPAARAGALDADLFFWCCSSEEEEME